MHARNQREAKIQLSLARFTIATICAATKKAAESISQP
jgi:hypothetical protein